MCAIRCCGPWPARFSSRFTTDSQWITSRTIRPAPLRPSCWTPTVPSAPCSGEIRLALNDDWREAIRFGCRQGVLQSCMRNLTSRMPAAADHGTVFMGSGDFHHLSWLLIEAARRAPRQPARVVVLDNHPDNMRFPGACIVAPGCVARLPQVAHVHVIGITSGDRAPRMPGEHNLGSVWSGKVTY